MGSGWGSVKSRTQPADICFLIVHYIGKPAVLYLILCIISEMLSETSVIAGSAGSVCLSAMSISLLMALLIVHFIAIFLSFV